MSRHKPKRRTPNLTVKLAAALLNMVTPNESGGYDYVLDRDECRDMTPEQICSLFQWDHGKLHGLAEDQAEADELMHPTNFTPRLIVPHRNKSRRDKTAIAKTRRISAEHEAFQQKILAKAGADVPAAQRKRKSRPLQSKPFPKVQRPMAKRAPRRIEGKI
jgi:hypothetical protein